MGVYLSMLKIMKNSAIIILCTICRVLQTGCGRQVAVVPLKSSIIGDTETSTLIGRECIVQLKRRLLGGNMELPISSLSNSINCAGVSVEGRVGQIDSEWIVLKTGQDSLWIPMDNVLLLRVMK
jgi:hypothetical protein